MSMYKEDKIVKKVKGIWVERSWRRDWPKKKWVDNIGWILGNVELMRKWWWICGICRG